MTNGREGLTEEEVTRFLQERLAAFKIPEIEFVSELPKNNLGKVRKDVLRKQAVRS